MTYAKGNVPYNKGLGRLIEPKICEICKQQFSPKYRVTKEYWESRRFCSYKCSDKAAKDRPSKRKGRVFTILEERFWAKVKKGKEDECWEWQGAKESQGYGILYKSRQPIKWYKAHRLSWELHFGEVPVGLCICHKCDNPSCINPKHLFLGTRSDNNFDRISKGRTADHNGRNNPMWGKKHSMKTKEKISKKALIRWVLEV